MRVLRTVLLIVVALVVTSSPTGASGMVGVYAVIERVVFEPDSGAPERAQIWGAFSFADVGAAATVVQWSPARRGYLYFTIPAIAKSSSASAELIRREWADLRSVAGSGQAVAFGSWGYIGNFQAVTGADRVRPAMFLERGAGTNRETDLRIRDGREAPGSPAAYQTNAGVVRVPADGSHKELVAQLRAVLSR